VIGGLYRLSLRALPRAFRDRYGRDMELVFADRLAEAKGCIGRASVVVGGLLDVLVQAFWERRASASIAREVGVGMDRRAWNGGWMGVLWSDVRQAVRTLRRSPGFALVAVSTLALGIGATTAVFSVVNALLLRPLPYADASRLVAVWPSATSNKTMVHRVAESVTALKSVSGISIWTVTVTGDTAAPEEVEVALVSPNHFETLGATPVLGRSFTAEEGRIGTDGVIVLSDAYWRRRCGRRVAVQLLTESAVLALAGGGLGVGLAFGLLRLIVSRAPADLPDIASISVDATVLGFALGASLLSSFLFGLAPVLRARGATAADALRQGMRGGIGAPRRAVVSHLLVGAEIGLAVLLVVGAGLMVRTLGRMYAVDPGFHAGGVLAFRVSPPSFRYGDAPAIRSFYSQLRERLAAIPAIESVAGIQLLPVTNGNWSFPVFIDGNPVPEGGTAPSVNFRVTTPATSRRCASRCWRAARSSRVMRMARCASWSSTDPWRNSSSRVRSRSAGRSASSARRTRSSVLPATSISVRSIRSRVRRCTSLTIRSTGMCPCGS